MIKMHMRRRLSNFTDGTTESTDIATMTEDEKRHLDLLNQILLVVGR